jgi:hypothetical protein
MFLPILYPVPGPLETPVILFQVLAQRVLRRPVPGVVCGWHRRVQEALLAMRGASEHLGVDGAKEERRQALGR